MNTYTAAVDYVTRKHWSVIPLWPRDKKPMIPWKPYQDRLPTSEELQEWFQDKGANIGIVTGKLSNLTVVDCDNLEAIYRFTTQFTGALETLSCKTGKGRHFYFQFAPGSGNFQGNPQYPGIDLRSEGGFVVAPPSIHPNGEAYEWEHLGIPQPFPPGFLLTETRRAQQIIAKRPADWFEPVHHGMRNQRLASLAGHLLKRNTPEDVLGICGLWNASLPEPMTPREVAETVTSITKAEQRNHPEIAPSGSVIVKPMALATSVSELYRTGLSSGVSTGWVNVDRFYRIAKRQWTMVSGIPGHGKSSFMANLMMNMIEEHRWKFLVFSAENYPLEKYLARLAEIWTRKPFSNGPTPRMSQDDIDSAINSLDDSIRFLHHDDGLTLSQILQATKDTMDDWPRLDGLIIDPWNELNSERGNHQTETDYIGEKLMELRRFARLHDIHIWVVVHPAKMQKVQAKDGTLTYDAPTPYDAHGSAHWRNKADMCLCVWRDIDEGGPTSIITQKVRFRECGQLGTAWLSFNTITGRYHEANIQE